MDNFLHRAVNILVIIFGILFIGMTLNSCIRVKADDKNISPQYFDNVNGVVCYTDGPQTLSCVKVN